MRGKRLRPALFAIENGNIPAYAGKTFALYLWVLGFQEHPRVCGKTRPCSIMGSNWSEHPRVCGENLHAGDKRQVRGGTSPRMRGKPPESITSAADRGTSPRMRGKPQARSPTIRRPRNIPAYAGKTTRGSSRKLCSRGTSPRMRGKHGCKMTPIQIHRNIPAYAGKTLISRTYSNRTPEHPRVCGENTNTSKWDWDNYGTSPRMRGKPGSLIRRQVETGNIPAYAGKTPHAFLRILQL